jgi:hypothetical protein
MANIYYIGGSPCSGKSTVTEILAAKYHLFYFKVDDFIDKYLKMGASKGYEICKKQDSLRADEIWMREPVLQCQEELLYYKETFAFVLEDLMQIKEKDIITEGAAYLPELMRKLNISNNRYISITPTRDFQISHYKKREWISFVLEGCSDKEKAFSNWMERDILFAKEVQKQCIKENYVSIINDGSIEVDEYVHRIAAHFGLY